MEISGLLNKFKKGPSEEPRAFLAVQIESEFVKTAIWTVKEEATSIIAVGSTEEWDGNSTDVLLEVIDSSLSGALQRLPEGTTAEPNQVIFGLPETWVGSDGITPARLLDLKRICKQLELSPVGFVVTTEAVTHYLRSKEGTPLTGILIRVSATEVAVTLVHLGKIEGTHVVGRSGDLASDVMEGLARFGNQESFPSRMVLYDGGEDIQDLTQQLMAFDWQSRLPFLHLPQIEAVPDSFTITAVAVAGGGEVAKSLGFTITKVPGDEPGHHDQPQESLEAEVLHDEPHEPEAPRPDESLQEPDTSPRPDEETAVDSSEVGESVSDEKLAAQSSAGRRSLPRALHNLFGLGLTLARRAATIPARLFHRASGRGRRAFGPVIVAVAAVALVSGGVLFAAKRFPKATVTVTFAGQPLSQRVRVTVDPAAAGIDPEQRILPAQKISVEKTGEKSQETTGIKTVGDKATGAVTVYNRRTDGSKTFTSGTVISADGKDFLFDTDVSVASASAGGDYSMVPGKASVNVTASAISPEYNLPSGTEFQVANFSKSTYVAKNDAAFSGGTKNDIQVASKKDQQELRDALLADLKSQAADDIQSQQGEKRIFPETLSAQSKDETFSANAGDEAGSIKLRMTAVVEALAVSNADLQDLLSKELSDSIPDGYTLGLGELTISTEKVEFDKQTVSFDVVVSARLSPSVSQTEITTAIAGKRPRAAIDTLAQMPHVVHAELRMTPSLPPFLQWVPAPSRTTVEMKLQE